MSERGRSAYDGDAAQITLQVVPVVAVIGAQNLVLSATLALRQALIYACNVPGR